MSDSHSPTRASAPFAPRALEPVTVGRTAVNLYPVIDQGMPPHERAHAFHINVTALSSQSIDLRAQLDALGHQLNLSATVDGKTGFVTFTTVGPTLAVSPSSVFTTRRARKPLTPRTPSTRPSSYPLSMGPSRIAVRMSNSSACSSLSAF